ncbi:MAG: ATP/GTP-binding protein [Chloroflexi bacterium]|nr:ATP/GTP-binding protein [Chloroflexota bacterium]
MPLYKVVITGPFNSGKTTFIKTISDIDVVSTERRITTEDRGIKRETTVAMDYGRAKLDGNTVHLNGAPGQTRFRFMWDILAAEMDAFVVLVDSTDPPSFPEAHDIITTFSEINPVPYLVVGTKSDLEGAANTIQIRKGTQAPDFVTVMPCNATQKSSIRQVLLQVVELIERYS